MSKLSMLWLEQINAAGNAFVAGEITEERFRERLKILCLTNDEIDDHVDVAYRAREEREKDYVE